MQNISNKILEAVFSKENKLTSDSVISKWRAKKYFKIAVYVQNSATGLAKTSKLDLK